MADIFLSYSREDQLTARRFAEAFERQGFSVWWDQTLRSGESYDEVTEQALRDAKAVVVLWSKASVASRWVRAEATQAARNKTLMPVMIEPCTRPIMFELTHTSELAHWRGDADDPAWRNYVSDVRRLMDEGKSTVPDKPPAVIVRSQRRSRTAGPALLAIAAIAAATVVAIFWHHQRQQAPVPQPRAALATPAAATASPAKPRIAVLPFENLSQDPNNAFFTDGLHEEVLTALANNAPGLDVISRTTMDTYKGKPATVEAIAKELNCAYVLEGSVRRQGNEVRLTVQLIDARNDSHVWAENYDRKLVNAMSLQSEVAAAIASKLSLKVAAGTAQRRPVTADPVAYDLYLKARAAEDLPDDAGMKDAASLLDQAIDRDSTFVRAFVERIGMRVNLFLENIDTTESNLAAIHQDLDRITSLAPQDPEVIAATAIVSFAEMDYDRALQLFGIASRAGLADPRLLDWNSKLLLAMGRYRDATALSKQLLDLDPKNFDAQYRLWFMWMELHKGEEALRLTEAFLARDPHSYIWKLLRASTQLEILGDIEPRKQLLAPEMARRLQTLAAKQQDWPEFVYQLNLEHRYGDARRMIDALSEEASLQTNEFWPRTRVGLTPRAMDRGWQSLLLGDLQGAQRDGQGILNFLDSQPATRWNKWYRALLRAEAQLFMGDHAAAIKLANEAVAITLASPDLSDQTNARVWTAMIEAWAGAPDDAAVQLESLSVSIPGLWPGEIVLNPQWTVPLAKNPRYVQLRERLLTQMKSTNLE